MTQYDPTRDLRDTLISDGVTTDIFLNKEPSGNAHDECITLYLSSDGAPSPKFLLDYPAIQIRSRARTPQVAYANALEVFDLLLGRAAFTVNTTRYTGIYATTGIISLGSDEHERHIYVANLRLITEPAAASQHRQAI